MQCVANSGLIFASATIRFWSTSCRRSSKRQNRFPRRSRRPRRWRCRCRRSLARCWCYRPFWRRKSRKAVRRTRGEMTDLSASSSASTMMTTTTAAVTINSFRFMLFKMLFNLSCDSYVFMIPIALGSDEQWCYFEGSYRNDSEGSFTIFLLLRCWAKV